MRMPLKWLGIAVTVLLALSPLAFPKDRTPDQYQILLTRLKNGDRTIDFLELRRAYAHSAEYPNEANPEDRIAMMNAFNRNDWGAALALSQKIQNEDYLDIEAHIIASRCNREMHIDSEADFHHFVAQGLIEGVLKSGDCKTMETACEVLSVHEEYVILQVLGLNRFPVTQSLVHSGKHSYDVLEGDDSETKKKVTLYFNIDSLIGEEEKSISK